jgi:hypothetical protein
MNARTGKPLSTKEEDFTTKYLIFGGIAGLLGTGYLVIRAANTLALKKQRNHLHETGHVPSETSARATVNKKKNGQSESMLE